MSLDADIASRQNTTKLEKEVVCFECHATISERDAYKTVSGGYVCKDGTCIGEYLDTVD